jgi:predicted  nucleic acid-binding Zn-ribbon protein
MLTGKVESLVTELRRRDESIEEDYQHLEERANRHRDDILQFERRFEDMISRTQANRALIEFLSEQQDRRNAESSVSPFLECRNAIGA